MATWTTYKHGIKTIQDAVPSGDAGLTINDNFTAIGDALDNVAHTSDISSKADKVAGAVNGNVANLDGTGNLVDSGATLASKANASTVSTLSSTVTAHVASTSNPHSTTYTQVGAAAASHTHAQSDVTGLTAALAAKAPIANPTFTGAVNATNVYAEAFHGYLDGSAASAVTAGSLDPEAHIEIGNVNGLTSALDAKTNTTALEAYLERSGGTVTGSLTVVGKLDANVAATTGINDYTSTTGATNLDTDAGNQINITLVGDATLTTIGTPKDGQGLLLRLTADADHALYLDATSLRVPAGITPPDYVGASTTYYLSAVYNAVAGKWDVIGVMGGY